MNIERTVLAVLLLASCACMAQTRYNNQLQPGLSTMAEVEQALGRPLREIRPSSYPRFEYAPPAGASKMTVSFLAKKVEVIEVQFQKPYARAAMISAMKLPDRPQLSQLVQGNLTEYYGAPALIVLRYVGADAGSGVSSVAYYSPSAFHLAVSIPPMQTAPAQRP